jgi:hypothetical protein
MKAVFAAIHASAAFQKQITGWSMSLIADHFVIAWTASPSAFPFSG